MRAFILAVTGLAFSVAACSSYGTAVVAIDKTPAHTASVSVSIPSSLETGKTARATATIKDASGTVLSDRTVTWYSSAASIATVNDSGLVAAIAPGATVVSAVSDGVAGQASVAVLSPPPPAPIPIATLVVSLSSGALIIGQTAHATATPLDSAGNPLAGRTVTWQSSKQTVASVNQTGDVSAIAAGSASISASAEGKIGAATLTVSAPAPIPVASVAVSPGTVSLQIGSTSQLSATTRDANNNVLTGRVISWSSSNSLIASVNASGLVSAVAAGTAQITATSEGKAASATITVSAAAPVPVASVSVSPASPSVTVGGTVQLSATTRDASGNTLVGRAVSWSTADSTVVKVSLNGLVSALGVGTTTVSATSEGKVGTASITVAAAAPPPVGGSNEPAGMTPISDQPFNSLPSDGWSPYNGWGIVSDAAAPKSPSNVFEIVFPAGFVGGNAPGALEKFIPNPTTLYVAMWIKYSANWQGHNTLVNKIAHFWINDAAGAGNHLIIAAHGSGSGPLVPTISLQGVKGGGNQDGGATGTYESNLVPSAQFIRGQWHKVEVIAVANTGSNANGSVDLYVDGVHVASCSGIEFVTANNVWGDFTISPTWGGEGDVVNNTMSLRIDHIYLSGKP